MGTFRVKIKLKNWQSEFLSEKLNNDTLETDALVDTGAVELALPTELIEKLQLKELGKINVYTADNARHELRLMGMIELTVQERTCHIRAIELPRGATPLLGAFPLELMDWHISPLERKLLPNPRSPSEPLLPLC